MHSYLPSVSEESDKTGKNPAHKTRSAAETESWNTAQLIQHWFKAIAKYCFWINNVLKSPSKGEEGFIFAPATFYIENNHEGDYLQLLCACISLKKYYTYS